MVVVVAAQDTAEAMRLLNEAGEKTQIIGRIESRSGDEAQTIVI